MRRLRLELLAQLREVQPQVAGVARVLRPPDLREQRLPGHQAVAGCAAAPRGSSTRSASAARVSVRVADRARDLARGEVDGDVAEGDDRLVRRPPAAAGSARGCGRAARRRRTAWSRSRRRPRRARPPCRRSRCGRRRRGSARCVQPRSPSITSMPSSSGIPRSSMTRSGWCSTAWLSASAPVRAISTS